MGDEARDIVGKREADACRSTEAVGDGGVEEEEERACGVLDGKFSLHIAFE